MEVRNNGSTHRLGNWMQWEREKQKHRKSHLLFLRYEALNPKSDDVKKGHIFLIRLKALDSKQLTLRAIFLSEVYNFVAMCVLKISSFMHLSFTMTWRL